MVRQKKDSKLEDKSLETSWSDRKKLEKPKIVSKGYETLSDDLIYVS